MRCDSVLRSIGGVTLPISHPAMQMPCGLFYSAWQFSCLGIIIESLKAYGAPEEIRTPDPQIRSQLSKDCNGPLSDIIH